AAVVDQAQSRSPGAFLSGLTETGVISNGVRRDQSVTPRFQMAMSRSPLRSAAVSAPEAMAAMRATSASSAASNSSASTLPASKLIQPRLRAVSALSVAIFTAGPGKPIGVPGPVVNGITVPSAAARAAAARAPLADGQLAERDRLARRKRGAGGEGLDGGETGLDLVLLALRAKRPHPAAQRLGNFLQQPVELVGFAAEADQQHAACIGVAGERREQ